MKINCWIGDWLQHEKIRVLLGEFNKLRLVSILYGTVGDGGNGRLIHNIRYLVCCILNVLLEPVRLKEAQSSLTTLNITISPLYSQ